MEQKPDAIRALVFIFAVGLLVTGLSTLQASEPRSNTAQIIDTPLMPMLDE
jgi:hypothetical protein